MLPSIEYTHHRPEEFPPLASKYDLPRRRLPGRYRTYRVTVWPIPYSGDFERVLNDKEVCADWVCFLERKEGPEQRSAGCSK
jgi:hypothetical protein